MTLHWRPPRAASGDRRFLLIEDDLARAFEVRRVVVADALAVPGAETDPEVDLVVPGSGGPAGRRRLAGSAAGRYQVDEGRLLHLLQGHAPDVLWLEHWHLAVARSTWKTLQRAGVRVVFDWDMRSRYFSTGATWFASRDPVRAALMAAEAASLRRFERSFLRQFDAVTVPSAVEARELASLLRRPVEQVIVEEPLRRLPATRPAAGSGIIGFLGSGYRPNQDALDWFIRRVWPSVQRALPTTSLHVAGDGLVVQPAPGVHALGRVDSAEQFIENCDVFISPVGYGSGTQNKIAQALALGVPVVAHPHGAGPFLGHAHLWSARSVRQWRGCLEAALVAQPVLDLPKAPARGSSARQVVRALLEPGAQALLGDQMR